MLDTNVVVSALLWTGSPANLLRAGVSSERFTAFTSFPMLAELSDVLSRSKFKIRVEELHVSVDELVALYADSAIVVRPMPVQRIAPDPDDDMVIGTALAAKADLVISGDRTLLSVGEYEAIRIVSVHEALRTIASIQL